MLHTADGSVSQDRTKRSLGLIAALLPTAALAEVSDKIPSIAAIWGVAWVAMIVLLLLMRLRPWWALLVLPLPAVWFGALLQEIHSPDVGPAIVHEQGTQFVAQVYLAVALVALGGLAGWWWRRHDRHRRGHPGPA